MAQVIKGTEQKYSIKIEAQGFSMDEDDFEVEVAIGTESVKGYKNPEAGSPTDVLIFKETESDSNGGSANSDSPSSASEPEEGGWFFIVNTGAFTKTGNMRAIVTAHIPDEQANDGIRDEVMSAVIGTLANP